MSVRSGQLAAGGAALLVIAPAAVALGGTAGAATPATTRPVTSHGRSADALRGVGEAPKSVVAAKTVEVDLTPTGYFPPDATIAGTPFTAAGASSVLPVPPRGRQRPADALPGCTVAPVAATTPPAQPVPAGEATCDIDGLDLFTTYTVHEVAPQTGFETAPDQSSQGLDVRTGRAVPHLVVPTSTLAFTNRGTWRPVTLTKTGAGGAPLAGAVYSLCAASTAGNPAALPTSATCPNGDLGSRTTDGAGHATWAYALPGSYSLVETAAPAGYTVHAPQAFSFPVSQVDGDPVAVSAADTLVPTPVPTPSASAAPTPSPVVTQAVVTSATPKSKPAPKRKPKPKPSVRATDATKPVAPTRALAFTGDEAGDLAGVGSLLLASGGWFVAVSRRRRADHR